ncbi:MAG: hypothetical protein KA793_06445 [Bacteroidales bacterium]|nr:hypothetical protein [Bacteroidales bacterium]
MALFSKLFGSDNQSLKDKPGQATFKPGRYVDINKTKEQTEYWDKAKSDFEAKRYLDSFYNLCLYMKDPETENLEVSRSSVAVDFALTQGSKIIKGRATENMVSAETRIARYEKPNIAFLRKLMNLNYVLQYNRFAIKDNIIYLKFTSKAIDASPNKLYYSLRELALKADKLDDVLVNEFDMLKPIDVSHIEMPPQKTLDVQYKYMMRWINDDLERISKLNEDRMAGAISYILLALLYRLDYLLVPQGSVLNDLEKINGIFTANDGKTNIERNRLMIDEFKKLAAKTKEDITREFYPVKTVFGYVTGTSHKTFYEFLLEQFKNTGWYYDNRHDDVVTNIYEYSMGYSLFNYGLYPATFELLKLAYQVKESDYFAEMGCATTYYTTSTAKFNGSAIEKEVNRIINKYKKDFPKLAMRMNLVKYKDMNEFLYTYLNEITYLNYSK